MQNLKETIVVKLYKLLDTQLDEQVHLCVWGQASTLLSVPVWSNVYLRVAHHVYNRIINNTEHVYNRLIITNEKS